MSPHILVGVFSVAFMPIWKELFAFTENRKLKTENEKKESHLIDGTPFTIRSSLYYELTKNRQAGLLALGSAGGGQPSHRGFL